MFDPQQDRRDYGDLLCPPVGYRLEFAVATTYSLDLTALTSAILRLGVGLSETGEGEEHPVDVLLAFDRIKSRLAVFCDKGGIKTPDQMASGDVRALYSLLDRIVVQVRPEKSGKSRNKDGSFPSFHPKMWLLHYKSKDAGKKDIYRLIVLSRNLTFDKSWDVVASFQGEQVEADSIKFKCSPQQLSRFLTNLSDSIAKVDFGLDRRSASEKHCGFKLKDILPMFSGAHCFPEQIENTPCRNAVVVTPFLSEDVLSLCFKSDAATGDNRPRKRVLITRKDAIRQLLGKEDAANLLRDLDCYVLKDDAVIQEQEGSQRGKAADLHAKMYFFDSDEEHAHLYIGSANATHSGFYRNTELMAHVEFGKYGAREFLRDVFCIEGRASDGDDWPEPDEKSPFERVEIGTFKQDDSPDDNNAKAVENALRLVVHWNYKANAKSNGEGGYVINVEVPSEESSPDDVEITFAPFCRPGDEKPLSANMEFAGIAVGQFSEFFIVKAAKEAVSSYRILRIHVDNSPKDDERYRAVQNAIVKDAESFSRYIQMLFAYDPDYVREKIKVLRKGHGEGSESSRAALQLCSYEEMLRAAGSDDERMEDLSRFVDNLGSASFAAADERISSEIERFKEMCAVFENAKKSKRRRP